MLIKKVGSCKRLLKHTSVPEYPYLVPMDELRRVPKSVHEHKICFLDMRAECDSLGLTCTTGCRGQRPMNWGIGNTCKWFCCAINSRGSTVQYISSLRDPSLLGLGVIGGRMV